jgi:ubiquinone/menaquinone biosynthesis C-methylase UbiE
MNLHRKLVYLAGVAMNEKLYNGAADRLRSPERLSLMEIARVVALVLENKTLRNMLDVGTGTAVFAEAFSRLGLDVSGVDSNPELLEVARSYLPISDFQLACADELPYADKHFDLLFLGHVLHETVDPLSVLKEAKRVARERIAILEWPYCQEKQGPPLEHRISPEQVSLISQQIGCSSFEHLGLAHMDLYLLTP